MDVVPDDVISYFEDKCAEIENDVVRRQLEAIDEFEALAQDKKRPQLKKFKNGVGKYE